MAQQSKSAAELGPIIVAVDYQDSIVLFVNETLRRRFQLLIGYALSSFAGGAELPGGDRRLWGRRNELIEILDGLGGQTARRGAHRIRLTQWQAKHAQDVFVALARGATHLTHPRLRAAMREILPVLPEGITVYFKTQRLPELEPEILATAPFDEGENYERLRTHRGEIRCPVCYGGLIRLAGWLWRVSAQVAGVRTFADQMGRMAQRYREAMACLETLG